MKIDSDLSIIDKIDSLQNRIDEEELDEIIVPELLEFYDPKIRKLARHAYDNDDLGYRAFKEESRKQLRKGVLTFSVRLEHWKHNDRSVGPYLVRCLNTLLLSLKDSKRRKLSNVCPACKEYLFQEDKFLICNNCSEEILRISKDDKALPCDKNRIHLHKQFARHSKKGYGCPDCNKFIPKSSLSDKDLVSCIYSNCSWFGDLNELKEKKHPGVRLMIETLGSSGDYNGIFFAKDKNHTPADIKLQTEQEFRNQFKILKSTMELQKSRITKVPSNRTIKKKLMYEAYLNILEKYPDDMIRYLVNLKIGDGLQAKIFQEFIKTLENNLPINMKRYGKDVEIYTLLDKHLEIFLGVSNFETTVSEKQLVHNETEEEYVASTGNNMGKCFIGLVEDVTDIETGLSLKDEIESYSFSSVTMNKSVKPGTVVKVTHLRIAPHYEIGGLVQLQAVRKKIVDSVYVKVHHKKRVIKKRNEAN